MRQNRVQSAGFPASESGSPHLESAGWVVQQATHRLGKGRHGEVPLTQHLRGPGGRESLRVLGLVVSRRTGERYQDRRQSPGAELRTGHHPRSRHDEIGNRVGIGHRIDEIENSYRGRFMERSELLIAAFPRRP